MNMIGQGGGNLLGTLVGGLAGGIAGGLIGKLISKLLKKKCKKHQQQFQNCGNRPNCGGPQGPQNPYQQGFRDGQMYQQGVRDGQMNAQQQQMFGGANQMQQMMMGTMLGAAMAQMMNGGQQNGGFQNGGQFPPYGPQGFGGFPQGGCQNGFGGFGGQDGALGGGGFGAGMMLGMMMSSLFSGGGQNQAFQPFSPMLCGCCGGGAQANNFMGMRF